MLRYGEINERPPLRELLQLVAVTALAGGWMIYCYRLGTAGLTR